MDATVSPTIDRRLLAGRILTGLPVAFLIFDLAIKLARIDPVVESFQRMGVPVEAAVGVGLLELACLLVHLNRRTAVLGAVLLTGFLGGAVALHMRLADPLASHTLFPVYIGALLWAGLYLRDPRVRALV